MDKFTIASIASILLGFLFYLIINLFVKEKKGLVSKIKYFFWGVIFIYLYWQILNIFIFNNIYQTLPIAFWDNSFPKEIMQEFMLFPLLTICTFYISMRISIYFNNKKQ